MIKVENLTFSYPGADNAALTEIDFGISKGEIFGFLGPSGAGKSTCQNILYKILSGYQGLVTVDGRNLLDWDRSYFENIGVGFELPNHYGKLTAKENLELFSTFYPKGKCKPPAEMLEMVGLENDGDKRVDSFSKGMKMRLNFVRALMHSPEILFFDEPTSGLDPGNAHIVKQHIQDLKKEGKTIFITTHDMSTADELCDRISFIVGGKLVLTDTPSDLKLKHGRNLVRVELDHETKEFPLGKLGSNSDFAEFLKQGEVLRIHTQEATLEQVFIEVTGEALKV